MEGIIVMDMCLQRYRKDPERIQMDLAHSRRDDENQWKILFYGI